MKLSEIIERCAEQDFSPEDAEILSGYIDNYNLHDYLSIQFAPQSGVFLIGTNFNDANQRLIWKLGDKEDELRMYKAEVKKLRSLTKLKEV